MANEDWVKAGARLPTQPCNDGIMAHSGGFLLKRSDNNCDCSGREASSKMPLLVKDSLVMVT